MFDEKERKKKEKKMRCAVFSDLHMANWQEFSSIDPISNLNTRAVDCYNVLMDIYRYCKEEGINLIIFSGDFFHDSLKITPDLYHLVNAWIEDLNYWGIRLVAIPGQHDYYRGNFTSLTPFINNMEVIAYSGGIINPATDIVFHFCFHRSTIEEQKEEISKIKSVKGKRNIFVGHFLVKELLEKGLYNLDIPCITYEDLPKGFDLYLFGDYHPHVHIPELNLASIGSTHQHTFGSVKRGLGGFLDLDLDTLKFERIELKAPMFIDVEDYKTQDFNDYDFYRVHVKGEKEVEDFRNKISDKEVKYRLVYSFENSIPLSKEEKEEYLVTMEPEEVLSKYLEKQNKPKQWIEKGRSYL